MTQFSLAPLDPLAMEDDVALASHDLKQCAAVVVSSPRDGTPMEDNQELHDEEDAAVETDVQPTPTTNQRQATKRVTFVDADIVEFEPTIWTATIASDGVPVGLSSNVRRRTRRRLDSYEGERLLHRINRQEYMEHGYLEPDERLEMLEAAGHSIAIINHVERETVRLNRERWESNEYDLLYQFGLGEPAIMDLDEDEELLLSQGTLLGFNTPTQSKPASFYQPVYDDDDDEMLEVTGDDDEGNPAEYYYYSGGRKPDVDVGFAMDEIDSYDTRKYEEWAWDYTTDGILSGDDQFGKNAFDLPSLDFGLPELSSSPTDVSTSNDCMVVSCGKIIGVGSPSSTQSKSLTSQHSPSTGAFV